MPHRTPLLAMALLALPAILAAGCAVQNGTTSQTAQSTQLGLALAQRDKMIRSMETGAIMEYTGGGEHVKARERIVARRPASVRVEVMSPVGVALVLAADAGQVAIFDPSKNTLMQGPATAALLDRYARIPMAPEAAVRLLMGLAPNSAMLAFSPNGYGQLQDHASYVVYREPSGVSDYLTFDTAGNLAMLRQTTARGREGYEVHYSDYRDIGGAIMFPFQVAASFPSTGASVKFRYEKPVIDGDIPDSTFVLSPSFDTRKITIGMWEADSARVD
jgi:hypothetical protein